MIKHERTGTEDASPNVGPSVPGYLPGTDLAQLNSFTSIQPHTAVQRELFNKIHLFIIFLQPGVVPGTPGKTSVYLFLSKMYVPGFVYTRYRGNLYVVRLPATGCTVKVDCVIQNTQNTNCL